MARKRRRDRKPKERARTGKATHDARVGDVRGGDVRVGSDVKLPFWLIASTFVVLTLLLFRAFVFSHDMLYGGDTLSLGYVARAFYANALKTLHRVPGWAPPILGGTPFLEALSGGDALYPTSLLLVLMEPFRALGWKLVLHVLAAGFFMYGWVRALGRSRAAGLLAGVAYMLAPFFVSLVHPGHDGKIFVTALTPLMYWAVERSFARGGVLPFVGTALVVAGVIYTTHFQMAYFLFGSVGLYALFRSVQIGRVHGPGRATKRFALFLAASVLGAAAAGVQLLPAVRYVTEYSRRTQTTREAAGETSLAWSSSWSLHPEEVVTLVLPEFAGNDAGGHPWAERTYWGRNPFKDNHEYGGLVVLLLAAVSFAGAARPGVRWFFTGLGTLALLFALGAHTPVWRIFYEIVPGVRLFRAPSQVIFLFGFGAATLAAFGLDRILSLAREGGNDAWRRPMRTLAVGTGVMILLALLASSGALTSIWTAVVDPGLDAARADALARLRPFISRGAWVGTFVAVGVTGLVWALRERYLGATALVAGLVFLAAADEMRVGDTFIQTLDFGRWAAPDPNARFLIGQESRGDPFRVFSVAQQGQDVKPAMYGLELVAGHHPNDLARYRELIGMVGSGFPRNLVDAPDIARLLNVRFIIWPTWQLGPQKGLQAVSETRTQDGRAYETVYAFPGLPRARLLARAVVKSDAEAVPYMLSDAFDPDSEVVLAREPPIRLDGRPVAGEVRWGLREPDHLRLSVRADRPALLVIADNWFPAWHATVDGKDAPVLRAYHTLRAVPVPAGEHTVELVYHSELVARSLVLSLLVLAGLLGAGGWTVWRRRGER